MSQYLLSVWFDEDYDDADLSTPENRRQMERTGALVIEMQEAGVWLFHAGLQSASTASVVRTKRGELSTTDGPYAESKEQMAGFWIIDAPDRDAALEWAAKATDACGRPVELRPMQE